MTDELPAAVAALLRDTVAPGETRTLRVRHLPTEDYAVGRESVAHYLDRLAGDPPQHDPIDHPEFDVAKRGRNARGTRWCITRRATPHAGGDAE